MRLSILFQPKAAVVAKMLPGVIFGSFLISIGDAKATPWLQTAPLAYTTTQGNFGGGPTTFDTQFSNFIGDKQVKILSTSGLPTENTVTFEYDPVYSTPWRVSYLTAGTANTGGNLLYRIKLDSSQDGLGVCATYNQCGPTFVLGTASPAHVSDGFVQTYYEAAGPNGNNQGALIGSINGSGSINLTGKNDIYVNVSWNQLQLTSGTTMGYSQVPAPLPILGTAAFFGSIRRIGQTSKRMRALQKG